MAFDGITIANIVKDLQDVLTDGRLSKIAQPEPDELLLTIKGKNGQQRLRKRFPAPYLSDGGQQAKPYDRAQFLHAFKKAYPERQDRFHYPAGAGAHRGLYGGASG